MALGDVIRITLDPPRCWIAHHRVHHYWGGLAVLAVAPLCGKWSREMFLIGLVIAVSDYSDADKWWSDLLASE